MIISVLLNSCVKTKTRLHFLYWVEFPSVVQQCQKHEYCIKARNSNFCSMHHEHWTCVSSLTHHLHSIIKTQTEERLTYLCVIIWSSAQRWTALPVSSCRPIRDLTAASNRLSGNSMSCARTNATARISSHSMCERVRLVSQEVLWTQQNRNQMSHLEKNRSRPLARAFQ